MLYFHQCLAVFDTFPSADIPNESASPPHDPVDDQDFAASSVDLRWPIKSRKRGLAQKRRGKELTLCMGCNTMEVKVKARAKGLSELCLFMPKGLKSFVKSKSSLRRFVQKVRGSGFPKQFTLRKLRMTCVQIQHLLVTSPLKLVTFECCKITGETKLLLFICTSTTGPMEICNFDVTKMDTHNFNVENVTDLQP